MRNYSLKYDRKIIICAKSIDRRKCQNINYDSLTKFENTVKGDRK